LAVYDHLFFTLVFITGGRLMHRMKHVRLYALAAVVMALLNGSQAMANLLANPGFEDPITSDGAPFVGSWEGFSAGAGAQAINSMAMPRSGAQHADLSIFNVNNSFAGVFQDVPNLVAGMTGVFGGWHKTPSDPFDVGAEIRIEWRNSVSDMEISRTPNLTPVPTDQYRPFSLTAMVPAGADTARVVYAIQTFGPQPTNNGTVFLDDMYFVIPEPTALSLLAFGSMGLAAVRRQRARRC
jgi:hypothetical protein